MQPSTSPYRCLLCTAASYRRLTHRGPDGAMQYSGLYRCSGCSVTFSDPLAWREGAGNTDGAGAEAEASPQKDGIGPLTSTVTAAAETVSALRSAFATWGYSRPLNPGDPIPFGYSEEDRRAIKEAADRATRSKGRRR